MVKYWPYTRYNGETMSFSEIWNGGTILERKGRGRIWGRDEELDSKKKKKHKKSKEHYRKDWDKDLWD